jgi:hypothetical protein
MKALAFTAIVCLAAVGSLSARAASTGGAPPCTPKITKIQGHQAAVNCGPATATLHISGKTYTFRNGFCQQSKSTGSFQLNLGTTIMGAKKGNMGLPQFSMLISTHLHTAFGSGSVFGADYGSKDLLGGDSLIKAGGTLAKGTFSSTITVGAKFTGSWSCHGVVWQAP